MRLIGRDILDACSKKHSDARGQIQALVYAIENTTWARPDDIRASFSNVDLLPGKRAKFDIKGGKCRIIVRVDFEQGWVGVRFCGTHSEYDKIDAETV